MFFLVSWSKFGIKLAFVLILGKKYCNLDYFCVIIKWILLDKKVELASKWILLDKKVKLASNWILFNWNIFGFNRNENNNWIELQIELNLNLNYD